MNRDLSSFGLENQIAIVTGASQGIGRTLAIALADQGALIELDPYMEKAGWDMGDPGYGRFYDFTVFPFQNEGKLYAVDTPENLKLQHGKRSVKVRVRENGGVTERIVEFDDETAGEELKAAVGAAGLMTIHTEEATLENIFIEMTGRGLEG